MLLIKTGLRASLISAAGTCARGCTGHRLVYYNGKHILIINTVYKDMMNVIDAI